MQPNQPGIMWDVDGVLCDTISSVFRELHSLGRLLEYGPDDVKSWDWCDHLPITKEEVYALYNEPDVLFEADHHLSGYHAFQLSGSLGYRRDVVTGRRNKPEIVQGTTFWLNSRNMAGERIFFVPAKEKAQWATENGIVLAVEDRYDTARALADAGVLTLLVKTGYNAEQTNDYVGDIDRNLWRVERNSLVAMVEQAHWCLVSRGIVNHDVKSSVACS